MLRTISGQGLFTLEDTLLVTLSGGPDSVALLRVLLELGFHCMAVHCNFHLRGVESERDENFVRALCNGVDVNLVVHDFDTKGYAATRKISIEMAAREQRYAFFEEISGKYGISNIVVAHHRDDNIETMLLNMIRGTGLRGLGGMRFRNGRVVRPFLNVSRTDILDYLRHIGQSYVTDSSNLETDFTRNKIRLQLLPLMEKINPSARNALAHTMERVNMAENLCRAQLDAGRSRVADFHRKDLLLSVDIEALLKEPAPEALLFDLLSPFGFTPPQIEDVFSSLHARTGAVFCSQVTRLLFDRGHIVVENNNPPESEAPMSLNVNGTLTVDGGTLSCRLLEADELKRIPREKCTAVLDAGRLSGRLTVRRVQRGDRFIPYGMRGYKLVSDYLTERKYSLFQKQKQYVVCDGEHIVWLVNERPDNRFAILKGKTKKILRIDFLPW